jgi:hypothetical protein
VLEELREQTAQIVRGLLASAGAPAGHPPLGSTSMDRRAGT